MTLEKGIQADFAYVKVEERHVRATAMWKNPHVSVVRHMGDRASIFVQREAPDAPCNGEDNSVELYMDVWELKELRDMINYWLGE